MLGIKFGQKLLYKVRPKGKDQKILARWQHGILIGVRRRMRELRTAVKDNVYAVRSVRRIPEEHRWGEDC